MALLLLVQCHLLSYLECSRCHTEECLIDVLAGRRRTLEVADTAALLADLKSGLSRNLAILRVVNFRADKHDVIDGVDRALLSEYMDVLADRVEASCIRQVKDDDSSLAIPKVRAGQRKVLLLALRVPDLQPDRVVIDLQRQTLQVQPDRVHLAFLEERIIDESD